MPGNVAMITCLLLMTAPVSHAWLGEVLAGAVCVVAAPIAVPAAFGFTAAGTAVGSFGATAMSYTAPVAAGSVVAMAQSVGAVGFGAAGKVVAFGVGSAMYHTVKNR